MIRKRSITIHGHRTSLSLEEEFWDGLRAIAGNRQKTLAALIAEIDEKRAQGDNLSSAVRVFVLNWFRSRSELLR